MQYLWIKEGGNIKINLINPEKGTDIKLKIITKDFLKLTDPKTVLEKILSEDYPIVSVNETLSINYNKQIYYIDITECKPSNTIQIIDVDLNVDFEKMEEPKKEENESEESNTKDTNNSDSINTMKTSLNPDKEKEKNNNIEDYKKNNEFVPFSGKGYTLGSS